MYWKIFGYLGILFAVIYRIPQIIKLYKTKKGGDLSMESFIIHNMAYVAFIIYLFTNDVKDYIIISYEFMGILQNCVILWLKIRYRKHKQIAVDNVGGRV